MQILVKCAPPAKAIELVNEIYQDVDVPSILFDTLHPDDEQFRADRTHDFITGEIDPESKTINIYLEGCMRNRKYMNRGILWPAASWMMLVFTLFHEYWHAKQLTRNTMLATAYPDALRALEEEADQVADESLMEWCKSEPMPKLKDMGWMGEVLRQGVNALYAKFPRIVEEIEDFEDGGAMRIEMAFEQHEFTFNGMKLLTERVKNGELGVVTRNGLCLNGYEALGL